MSELVAQVEMDISEVDCAYIICAGFICRDQAQINFKTLLLLKTEIGGSRFTIKIWFKV